MIRVGWSLYNIESKTRLQNWMIIPNVIVVHETLSVHSPCEGWSFENYKIVPSYLVDVEEGENQRLVRHDIEFDGEKEILTPVYETIEAPDIKNELYNYAEEKRYNKENGGITISGTTVPTDRLTRSYIFHLANNKTQVSFTNFIWKSSDRKFTNISINEIERAASVMPDFIQNCFSVESLVFSEINNGIITSKEQIDSRFNSIRTDF